MNKRTRMINVSNIGDGVMSANAVCGAVQCGAVRVSWSNAADAHMFDGGDALGAFRREMRFVVDFAEKLTALFDKTAVLERCAALRVGAHERIRGEGLTESQDEGPSA